MNLFLIRSPFCYLNALEAQSYFQIIPEDSILIVFYISIESIDIVHIKKLYKKEHWNRIIFVPRNAKVYIPERKSSALIKNNYLRFRLIKRFLQIYRYIKHLNEIIKKIGNVERIILQTVDDYSTLHFVNKLKPRCIYALDEGCRVVITNDQRKSKIGDKWPRLNSEYLKKIVSGAIFGYHVRDVDKITYFTAYNLTVHPNDKVIQHSYPRIRKEIQKTNRISNTVYFLGSALSEIGLMSEDNYMKYLIIIKNHFENYTFVYIAHRGDSEKKINRIKKELKIDLINFNLPIEYQLATEGPIPEIIASFYSAALYNCYLITGGDIKCFSIYLHPQHINQKYRKRVQMIYQSYKAHSNKQFQVIDLMAED